MLGTEEELQRAAQVTSDRILQVEQDPDKNWRIWRNHRKEEPIAWGTFAGYLKGRTHIILDIPNGNEMELEVAALSQEDLDWLRSGRFWQIDGVELRGRSYHAIDSGEVYLLTEGPPKKFALQQFSPEDQDWIKRTEELKKRSPEKSIPPKVPFAHFQKPAKTAHARD